MNIKQIALDLCAMAGEQEWFEFKENWFQPEALGEYVSALSNAAAFHYKAHNPPASQTHRKIPCK